MKAFLSAVVVSLIVAVAAAFVLDGALQQPSFDAYTSPEGVRLDDPGRNLVDF